jgi:deazaflavin-dependent oxidoreductase (nitroreductase family)
MSEQEVVDSPTPFVADHIKSYVESDGANGHDWQGVPTLLLTTKGRKSGVLRRSALIYGRDGDDLVIVASKGGADDHPAWYLNLVSEPSVHVQVGPEQFDATAITADPSERARLWPVMAAIWPDYDQYATKTEREIPVVVLKRV